MKDTPDGSTTAVPELKVRTDDIAEKLTAKTEKLATKWNTKNLGLRLGVDTVAAACSGVLIAPVIAIIDQYVSRQSLPMRRDADLA
jgi:hypothetical protein